MTHNQKSNWLGAIIAIPAIAVLGYEGGKYCINILLICILPFLGRYLYRMVKKDLFTN